jgi:NADH dehydrogenase
MLTFVIVGGGFAGIETAGELMDLLLDVKKHYPHIQKDHISVTVIESGPRIILGFDDKMAKFAYEAVTKRGIDVRLNCAVSGFNGIEATIKKLSGEGAGQEEVVRTNTLVWTAGVAAADAIRNSILKTDRGKLVVNEFLELSGFPGVFAAGDCALCINPETKRPFPPTAQIAEAQAKTAAANLHALIRNKKKAKFDYRAKGHMAIIGKRAGIATFMGRNIVGFWAWILWRNMYLSRIPGTEKRIRVLLDWTIDLFFGRDVSRMDVMKKPRSVGFRETEEQDIW